MRGPGGEDDCKCHAGGGREEPPDQAEAERERASKRGDGETDRAAAARLREPRAKTADEELRGALAAVRVIAREVVAQRTEPIGAAGDPHGIAAFTTDERVRAQHGGACRWELACSIERSVELGWIGALVIRVPKPRGALDVAVKSEVAAAPQPRADP